MNVNITTGGALLSVSDLRSRFPNYVRQLVEIGGTIQTEKASSNDIWTDEAYEEIGCGLSESLSSLMHYV